MCEFLKCKNLYIIYMYINVIHHTYICRQEFLFLILKNFFLMLSEFNFNILLVHDKFVKLHDQSVSCTRTESYNVKDNGLRVNQNYESIFVL